MRKYVSSSDLKLESVFKKASSLNSDDELKSHFSKYLTILTYGYIEDVTRFIYVDYAKKRSNNKIHGFIESTFKDYRSWKPETIIQIAKLLDQSKGLSLESFLVGEYKSAIESITNTRHQLAHGKSTSISYNTISEYKNYAVQVVHKIDEIFKNAP